MDISREKIEELTMIGDRYLNGSSRNYPTDRVSQQSESCAAVACAFYLAALVRIKVKQNYEDKTP